jgi:lysozyme family protein
MPSAAFLASLPFVLRWEGGYADHPDDPGGRTNRGVTQATYDRWRANQGLAPRHVGSIDDDEVASVYEIGYWAPPRCDLLRRHLDLVHFDTAVNMGPGRAVRLLQAAVGCPVDGAFGPETVRHAAACDLGAALAAYCDGREAYYRRLADQRPRLRVFLRGWLNRLHGLRAEVGLPGFEAEVPVDFGETDRIARIPDVGLDPDYDIEEP